VTPLRAVFKVLLIGEGAVGKTSLLKRATQNTFDENMKLTVGVDFAVRDISLSRWEATLQIWDLGGQVRFRELAVYYFKGARIAIAVFDVSSPHTLDRLEEWIANLQNAEGSVPLVVVANKIDLRGQLSEGASFVSPDEGRAFAAKHHAPYVEASAKTSQGVDEIFKEISRILMERFPNPEAAAPKI
jgi:small GTP-binding protein